MTPNLAASLYLISGVLFILALRGLSSPETSRKGNFFGVLGMILAITTTFLSADILLNGFIFVINLFDLGGKKLLENKGYKTYSLMDFPGH